MIEIVEQPSQQPEYYYCVSSDTIVLVGALAVKEYTKFQLYIEALLQMGRLASASGETGGLDPGPDFWNFGDLLVSDIPVSVDDANRLDVSKWQEDHYLSFGHFLAAVPTSVEADPSLYARKIERSNHLGLGPSVGQIRYKKRFKSLGLYYKRLMLPQTRRTNTYNELSDEELLEGLRIVNAKLGHEATRFEIDEIARGDPAKASHKIYVARFESLKNAHEAAGSFSTHTWNEDDFRKWGYHFILANGRLFATEDIRALSRKRKGPSLTKIFSAIGSVRELQEIANDEFMKKASEIEGAINNGSIPSRLFRKTKSVSRVITSFTRYTLADELLPHLPGDIKIDICKARNHDDFINRILEQNPILTLGEIEVTARWLHVFDDLWPNSNYMKDLKINRPENKQPRLDFLKIVGLTQL